MLESDKKKLELRYGVVSPPISEQLEAQGFYVDRPNPERYLSIWQRSLEAINFCHIHNCLTDCEAKRARKRLHSHIAYCVKAKEEGNG